MNFTIVNHPLVQHKIAMLRDIGTGTKEFREVASEIASLICYEATRDCATKMVTIQTPICEASVPVLADNRFCVVPIIRAGIGMADGILTLLPTAKVGHIGLYRDPETLQPVEYFCKLPSDIAEREVLLVDPMLATGGTAHAAITFLKDRGVTNIKLLCLVSCPEGVARVHADFPDVHIYTAAHDRGLNEHAYIVPGLGDAGDRLFGTK